MHARSRWLVLGLAVLLIAGCSEDNRHSLTGPDHHLSEIKSAPAGYYDTVDDVDAATLRATLHAAIDDHAKTPYTSTATDTWNVLELADQDPNDSGRILDLYLNASYPKYGEGNLDYNREHTWPSSYGFPNDGASNYPYTDCHHLFLSNDSRNSSRGNKPYATAGGSGTEYTTEINDGVGGGSGVYPGWSNWADTTYWETWWDRRGDVARALMYMDVRYEGGTHGVTGYAEPDLILTDDLGLIEGSNTGSNETVAYMGLLSVLVQWHADDPVDAKEMNRNDAVYSQQGNRNPFIDHPEWVDCLFNGTCDGGGVVVPPTDSVVWINEFHYDNDSTDTGEFVEVAGEAGASLTGWSLVAYNGNGGLRYDTEILSGTFADLQGGFGVLSFAYVGLQNGSPDGIALVDATGDVVQFLSYEGVITAMDGPALGLTSIDVGVSEPSDSPVGWSLQLSGSGSVYDDFTWQAPMNGTPGAVNTGQTLGDGAPVNQAPTAVANGPYAAETGALIAFSSTGSYDPDGSIVAWLWDFGNGDTSSSANPDYAYASAGSYTATLTVTDDQGAQGVATASVVISEPASSDTPVHVDAITAYTTVSRKEYGFAAVTVLDDQGGPVAGLTVTGTFSGGLRGTYSAVTGADGTAVVANPKGGKVGLSFTFCVDDVTGAGFVYDAAANAVTCASH